MFGCSCRFQHDQAGLRAQRVKHDSMSSEPVTESCWGPGWGGGGGGGGNTVIQTLDTGGGQPPRRRGQIAGESSRRHGNVMQTMYTRYLVSSCTMRFAGGAGGTGSSGGHSGSAHNSASVN